MTQTASFWKILVFLISVTGGEAIRAQTFFRFPSGNLAVLPDFPADGSEDRFLWDVPNSLPKTFMQADSYGFFKGDQGLYLVTLSENGFLYYLGKTDWNPKAFGGRFFVTSDGQVVAVDRQGFVQPSIVRVKPPRYLGGSYAIDSEGILTTVKSEGSPFTGTDGKTYFGSAGQVVTKDYPGSPRYKEVVHVGGNFFVLSNGTIVTINDQNGFFIENTPHELPLSLVGGNYFVDIKNQLVTINKEGVLIPQGVLPAEPRLAMKSLLLLKNGTYRAIRADGRVDSHVIQSVYSNRGYSNYRRSTILTSDVRSGFFYGKAKELP